MLNMIKSAQNKIVSKISNELLFVKEYGKVIITNRIYENEEFYLEISESGTYKLPNESTLILDKNICTFITSKVKIWYNSSIMMAKAKEDKRMIVYDRKSGFYCVKTSASIEEFFKWNKLACEMNKNLLKLREISAS